MIDSYPRLCTDMTGNHLLELSDKSLADLFEGKLRLARNDCEGESWIISNDLDDNNDRFVMPH